MRAVDKRLSLSEIRMQFQPMSNGHCESSWPAAANMVLERLENIAHSLWSRPVTGGSKTAKRKKEKKIVWFLQFHQRENKAIQSARVDLFFF